MKIVIASTLPAAGDPAVNPFRLASVRPAPFGASDPPSTFDAILNGFDVPAQPATNDKADDAPALSQGKAKLNPEDLSAWVMTLLFSLPGSKPPIHIGTGGAEPESEESLAPGAKMATESVAVGDSSQETPRQISIPAGKLAFALRLTQQGELSFKGTLNAANPSSYNTAQPMETGVGLDRAEPAARTGLGTGPPDGLAQRLPGIGPSTPNQTGTLRSGLDQLSPQEAVAANFLKVLPTSTNTDRADQPQLSAVVQAAATKDLMSAPPVGVAQRRRGPFVNFSIPASSGKQIPDDLSASSTAAQDQQRGQGSTGIEPSMRNQTGTLGSGLEQPGRPEDAAVDVRKVLPALANKDRTVVPQLSASLGEGTTTPAVSTVVVAEGIGVASPSSVIKVHPESAPTAKPESKSEINPGFRPPQAREILLRIPGSESGSVDLRVIERAGKVQVSVRTPDVDLAQSLRAGLGELVGRLEKGGFDTEVLNTADRTMPLLHRQEPASMGANQGEHGAMDGKSGGNGQDGQRQRNRQRRVNNTKAFSLNEERATE